MKIAGSLSEVATDGNVEVMSHKGLEMHQKFFPAGTSFRAADHLRQLVFNNGKGFTKYDFLDPAENLKRYGQEEAPAYNWENISGFKITLIVGKTDLLASPLDTTKVKEVFTEKGASSMNFHEFPHGHMGLLYPKTSEPTDVMFKAILEAESADDKNATVDISDI